MSPVCQKNDTHMCVIITPPQSILIKARQIGWKPLPICRSLLKWRPQHTTHKRAHARLTPHETPGGYISTHMESAGGKRPLTSMEGSSASDTRSIDRAATEPVSGTRGRDVRTLEGSNSASPGEQGEHLPSLPYHVVLTVYDGV